MNIVLIAVREAVAIRVRILEVGAEGDLLGVGQAVHVAVEPGIARIERIGAGGDLGAGPDTVAVGVRIRGIGTEQPFLIVRQTVEITVENRHEVDADFEVRTLARGGAHRRLGDVGRASEAAGAVAQHVIEVFLGDVEVTVIFKGDAAFEVGVAADRRLERPWARKVVTAPPEAGTCAGARSASA